MDAIAVVFAGGVGSRFGPDSGPKQFVPVGGRSILSHTLAALQAHPRVAAIYLACLAGHEDAVRSDCAAAGFGKVRAVVTGGATSQDSTRNALDAAASDWPADTLVLVHDGVRPTLQASLVDALLDAASRFGNAVTCRPAAETMVTSDDGAWVGEVLPRSASFHLQAPQVFSLGALVDAHARQSALDPAYTDVVDSASLMVRAGHRVRLVEGPPDNLKITHASDLAFFAGWLGGRTP